MLKMQDRRDLAFAKKLLSLALLSLIALSCQKKPGSANYRTPLEPMLLLSSDRNDQSAAAKISIPAQFSDLSGKLQIEEGVPITDAATAAALNIGETSLTQAGPSINVSANAAVDFTQIGRLEISIPLSESSSLALDGSFLAVIYQITDADGKTLIGAIPPANFKVAESLATFKMLGFGNYQAVRLKVELKEEIKVASQETKILSKSAQLELPSMTIAGISPLIAYKGQKVSITGSNFRPGIKLAYLGRPLSQLEIQSDTALTVVIDEAPRRGSGAIFLAQDGVERSFALAYAGSSSDFPLMTLPASEVCVGQKYYNANGDLLEGTRICNATAAVAEPLYSDCSSDGQTGCITTGAFKAAKMSGVTASVILSGSSIAGISGSLTLPTVSKVLTGTLYGAGGNALSGTLTLPAASSVLVGSSVYGDSAAQITPTYSPDFPALANVHSSDTVNGSTGTLNNCTGANQSGCVTSSTYKSMNLTGSGSETGLTASNFNTAISSGTNFEFWDASGTRHSVSGDSNLSVANIKTGVSVFGITGSASGTPNCSSNGSQNCVATGTFYAGTQCTANSSNCFVGTYAATTQPLRAISYDDIDNGKAAIRTSLTLAGIAGTLQDCSASGTTGCVTTTAYKSIDLSALGSNSSTGLNATNFNTSLKTAANFEFWDSTGARHQVTGDADLSATNIVSGVVIHGISGSATSETHTNCGADGATGCVVVGPTYAAALTTGLASKILVSQTVAGVNGTLTLPPVAKVLTGTSYGAGGSGSTGTLTLPLASNVLIGSGTYGDQGATLSPSYSPDFPSAANVRAIDTVNGATGTLANCSAGGSTDCVTTITYKAMDLSIAGTATGLTAANFHTRIASPTNSEFWDATGARHFISGDVDLAVGNVKSGTNLFGVAGQYPSASYPLASNTGVNDLTTFITQLTTDGNFEYFDSAGAKYTGSGDSDLVNGNIKNLISIENLSLTGSHTPTLNCPAGYIKVPGDSAYGTGDFCVMKYEAKNVSAIATSQAASTPWVSISQTGSITACRALGTGYDLISNPQWMTIGANAAGINGNWTGGTSGSGSLFAGHNDNSPVSPCAASSNDSFFYVETTCSAVGSGDSTEQRRTLTLSNSNVIWDLSGNVSEWVNYKNIADKPGATAAYYEYTALTGTSTTALKDLVPTNAVKGFWSDAWNSAEWIGNFYPGTNGGGGGLVRGGSWSEGSSAGVFNANLYFSPTASNTEIGVRCSANPILVP